jgi:acyl-CoA thioesterase FadM
MSFSWRGHAERTDALGRHLSFDAILGLFRDCWASFFSTLDARLDPAWMLLRHLRADFAAEVLAGEAEITLMVLATGRSSVRLELTARQAGRRVAGLEAVFIRCDPVSGKPRELARAELSALSRYRTVGPPDHEALTTTRADRRRPPVSGPS